MVESRSLDLNRFCLACKDTLPENKLHRFGSVRDVELRAKFPWEALLIECFGETEFIEDGAIVRQERFANVKTRKDFLFQDENFSSCFRKKSRRRTTAGTAADYDYVKLLWCHGESGSSLLLDGVRHGIDAVQNGLGRFWIG